MRIIVVIDTAEADDGYDPDDTLTFGQHVYEIGECLRAGRYNIDSSTPVV